MAPLPAQNLKQVTEDIMARYSADNFTIPLSEQELYDLIVLIDSEGNAAETAVYQALGPGKQRDWLQQEEKVSRSMFTRVFKERTDHWPEVTAKR